MARELIAVKASIERDPDGSKLSNVLSAHLALERARLKRALLVHVTAALSVPVWFMALWPDWLALEGRRLVLLSWALSAVTTAAATVREWRWRWRRDSQAAEIRDDLPFGR